MDVPGDLRYSTDHEWARVEGTRARVGVTDYAQEALGDVVYLRLPDVGSIVGAGQSVGEVESTKSVSDVYAPLSGTVVEVNEALVAAPERLNEDPYGEGWLYVVELSDPVEADRLLDAEAYRALVEG